VTPSAQYRRARHDLTGALDQLIARGRSLASSRYGNRHALAMIRDLRPLRTDVSEAITYAVLAARAAGHSWAEVAAELSLDEDFTREHYEPIERLWTEQHTIDVSARLFGVRPLRRIG
jgi:hypothetical protein